MIPDGDQARLTLRFAIDLLRSLARDDIASAREILTGEHPDLHDLYALLDRWRLAGYFHTLVCDTPLTDFFPDDVLRELDSSYRLQAERSQASLRLLVDVQRSLAAASIPFLSLKGLYLAQRFFGDVRRRFMWDIDILVHKDNLQAAIVAVEGLGLKPPPGVKIDPKVRFWGIHAVEVRGEAGSLDIHHALRNLPNINFDYDQFWSNAQEFTLGDVTFPTLSDEDNLLFAAVALGVDIQTSRHNLRKIWDIYIMLRQMDGVTDWGNFFAKRDQEGSLKLVVNVFSFCLLLLRATQDCPYLARAISAHNRLLLIADERQAQAIFARGRRHLANRLLFSRLLPVSVLQYWLRWLITVPVRAWHYH